MTNTTTECVLYDDLSDRIDKIKGVIFDAEASLIEKRDYLSCAKSLQEIATITQFDPLLLHIMEIESKNLP